GDTLLEADLEVKRLVGRVAGRNGPGIGVLWRFRVGVFQNARLGAPAPQVLIGTVWRVHSYRNGDVVLPGILDLLLAAHAPLADWCDHLQIRSQRRGGDVEAHLVVALAGAAVGYQGRAGLPRYAHHQLCD